jgi:8-oxo-dGTP pyrophosphatase MutT (NUDIX family)
VLLSKRKVQGNGTGEFGGPGGALLPGETMTDAVLRELAEECGPGVMVKNLHMLWSINYRNSRNATHWVGIGFAADYVGGEIIRLEPDKHAPWNWHLLEHLPTPLYWPTARYIDASLSGQKFFEW